MTKVTMGIPWHGFVGTALWILVVSCCLALALPNISSWWSGATPCGVVPECVEKVTNAYPQTYHAFVAVGLGVVLLREGTLLLVSVADQLMTSALQKKKTSNLAHRLEFKDFLAQYLLCMLLSSLTSFETYLASTSMPLVHVVQNAVVPVYTVRYIEWLVDVPLLMTLTCCGALGRPLSQALGPIVATNCYIIVSWAALFLEDACVRNTVITATFVAYAWASERMIQWVRDFLRESQDVPCRNTRVASVILLIVVFGIYGIIYLAGVAGLISFEMEHLGYTFMGFSCKVTLSILFASIRAYQNHQVLARLVGKLRGVSVAFVSLLRGSFDHVERSSRDFQDLERFLGKTMESKNFNDLLDKDDRERFTNYVRNAVRQNDLSFQQMDAGTITSQPPVAHALHISLQRDAALMTEFMDRFQSKRTVYDRWGTFLITSAFCAIPFIVILSLCLPRLVSSNLLLQTATGHSQPLEVIGYAASLLCGDDMPSAAQNWGRGAAFLFVVSHIVFGTLRQRDQGSKRFWLEWLRACNAALSPVVLSAHLHALVWAAAAKDALCGLLAMLATTSSLLALWSELKPCFEAESSPEAPERLMWTLAKRLAAVGAFMMIVSQAALRELRYMTLGAMCCGHLAAFAAMLVLSLGQNKTSSSFGRQAAVLGAFSCSILLGLILDAPSLASGGASGLLMWFWVKCLEAPWANPLFKAFITVLVHLSLVPHGGESDRRGNRLAAFLALQITSQEVEWPMDHSQMREVEDKVTDVPYSSGTPSTDDVSTEGRGQEGQRISLSGTRDTEDELSATISLGEAAKRSNVGKNISNKRRKRDAKLLVKILQRRLRRKSRKDSKDCETSVKADVPGRVSDRQSDRMSRMSDKTSIQKVSFICGGSDVRSQSSRLSAANSVMMACRQLLGPLHDELPPAQYISRRMEDHLQCSAEMVKLKACSEITRHSQKQKMDEWKRRHDAHQLSVMLEKSGAPGCGLPEQLWRSEVLGNLNESHPAVLADSCSFIALLGSQLLCSAKQLLCVTEMAPRKNNKRSTDAKESAKRQKTDEAEAEAEDKEEVEEQAEGEEPQVEDEEAGEAKEAAAQEEVVDQKAEDNKGPVPRLMIRQIVLENFKSYGGVKVIGPFHKSFSSIVGPNGSGKSNTIDALLFVFGKRAKKMRLNKVSELIHSSNAMPNLNSAKVEVTFQDIVDTGDGPEDYEVVKGSVLTVTREAFRNNQSKYYVDGKTSNFTEVVQLLRKRGVDLDHNRFLILQGEVEQISLMKPKAQSVHEDGLLEYLEDIIGSNRLLEPIEQADGIVEKLTEQRQEKLNRLRVAEREKEALDGPRKEAEAWVSGEAERLELQSLLAQSQVRKSQGNLGSLEDEHKVLQGHMKEHKKKMETFEKEVKGIEAEHNNHLKDAAGLQRHQGQDGKESGGDVKYTEDIAFQEQKIQKLSQASEEEQERAKQLIKDAEKLRNDAPVREQEPSCPGLVEYAGISLGNMVDSTGTMNQKAR
eukprot:s613_g17.t3